MKRLLTILAVLALTSLSPAQQLRSNHSLRADIAFQFAVADKVLAPGTYILTWESSGVLKVYDKKKEFRTLTLAAMIQQPAHNRNRAVLIFRRYGNTYFLAELRHPNAQAVSIPKGSKERQVELEALRNTVVEVAARAE